MTLLDSNVVSAVMARAPDAVHPEISTLNGERLEYSEIVVAGPDTWVLLTGCVNTANGPGMVLRTQGPQGLTRPRFLPLVPGVSRLL